MFQYVILANMTVLITLGIRQQYLAYMLRVYMKEKYPQKLEEFFSHTFTSAFRMDRWLHKEDDAGDPKLIRLKAKAKHATDITALVFLLSPLLWIVYFVVFVLTGRGGEKRAMEKETEDMVGDKMFLNINIVVPVVLGIILLVLAPKLADAILSISEDRGFASRKYRNLLYVWPIRFMGCILIGFGLWKAASGQ